MKTTLFSRPVLPGTAPAASAWSAASTCAVISAWERLRLSPPWPVAQNGQAMPQPAWDEMHSVVRLG